MKQYNGQPVYTTVKGRLSQPEKILHTVLIMCSGGLWYPVYWSRKRKAERVTTTYAVPLPPSWPQQP